MVVMVMMTMSRMLIVLARLLRRPALSGLLGTGSFGLPRTGTRTRVPGPGLARIGSDRSRSVTRAPSGNVMGRQRDCISNRVDLPCSLKELLGIAELLLWVELIELLLGIPLVVELLLGIELLLLLLLPLLLLLLLLDLLLLRLLLGPLLLLLLYPLLLC